MGEFKPAWDRRTGEQLPYLVPKAHFKHPWFKDRIVSKPPKPGGIADQGVPAATKKEGK